MQKSFKLFVVLLTCLLAAITYVKTERQSFQKNLDPSETRTRDVRKESQVYPGPFISRPDVLRTLGRLDGDGSCKSSGPLAFACLVQQIEDVANRQQPSG